VPPLKVFVPDKVRVPVPFLTSDNAPPWEFWIVPAKVVETAFPAYGEAGALTSRVINNANRRFH